MQKINDGKAKPSDFHKLLPTGESTLQVTAILEAGRMSLDNEGKRVVINYDEEG